VESNRQIDLNTFTGVNRIESKYFGRIMVGRCLLLLLHTSDVLGEFGLHLTIHRTVGLTEYLSVTG